ncbi:MAG: hypothetical protein LBQ47_03780 [Endomicrobium sp.]|nr:hypothetical protein [Endomicrobium sp.]
MNKWLFCGFIFAAGAFVLSSCDNVEEKFVQYSMTLERQPDTYEVSKAANPDILFRLHIYKPNGESVTPSSKLEWRLYWYKVGETSPQPVDASRFSGPSPFTDMTLSIATSTTSANFFAGDEIKIEAYYVNTSTSVMIKIKE